MFATTLKNLRNLRKITQRDLAREFNLTQQAVGKWEAGVSMPDYETLGKIADYFEVSVDYLIGREKKSTVKDDGFSDSEYELVSLYRLASPDDRMVIDAVLKKYRPPRSAPQESAG